MNNLWRYIIVASAVVLSAMVLAAAYTQRARMNTGTITVTGLGETEFTSDIIVVKGNISLESQDAGEGYRLMEQNRNKVIKFLKEHGVDEQNVSFDMLSTYEQTESLYQDGKYIGERFAGYSLTQAYTIESSDVESVEAAARELSSLITEGIDIKVYNPMYYYSGLESVKLDLLAAAAADARERALKIAQSSEAKLGELAMSRAGVFQITAATGDEEFSAGGSFNLSSREKKARVTVRSEYKIARIHK